MIAPVLLSVLAALTGTAVGQTFEPAEFNATESLLSLGVDVTDLPELSNFVERSTNFPCAAAVSLLFPYLWSYLCFCWSLPF